MGGDMTSKYVGWFVARRVVALALLLIVISFGIFSLQYIAPGSTEQILLGERPASPATFAALRREYHLDKPFLTQYWIWARDATRFDFGRSSFTLQPVTQAIRGRLPVSLFLAAYAFVLTMTLGVALGVLAALRARSTLDRSIVGLSIVGVSAPAFASGVLLLFLFAVHWRVFPAFGAGSGFLSRLYHLTLPAAALALSAAALVVKVTRAAMIEALRQDYVGFARARGLSRTRVVLVYALRNALVPVVTSAGLILAYVFTGTVFVETVFSLPGIGQLLIQSVESKDLPVVQGVALLVAASVITINLIVDLVYLVVDPRIRFDRAGA